MTHYDCTFLLTQIITAAFTPKLEPQKHVGQRTFPVIKIVNILFFPLRCFMSLTFFSSKVLVEIYIRLCPIMIDDTCTHCAMSDCHNAVLLFHLGVGGKARYLPKPKLTTDSDLIVVMYDLLEKLSQN